MSPELDRSLMILASAAALYVALSVTNQAIAMYHLIREAFARRESIAQTERLIRALNEANGRAVIEVSEKLKEK